MAQRFNASGGGGRAAVPGEHVHDRRTSTRPRSPSTGRGTSWSSGPTTTTTATILAGQKYSSSGAPVGGQFQVNTDTSCCVGYNGFENPGIFDDIDIAGDAAGNFVVAWKGPSSPGGEYQNIVARVFDSSGIRHGRVRGQHGHHRPAGVPHRRLRSSGELHHRVGAGVLVEDIRPSLHVDGHPHRRRLPGELRRLLLLHRRAEHRRRCHRTVRHRLGGVRRTGRHRHGARVRQHGRAGR